MIGDRLYTFVVANEYGSRIAAQCVGELIYAVVKVRVCASCLPICYCADSCRQILSAILRACELEFETITYR